MAIQFSRVVTTQAERVAERFAARNVPLREFGDAASPLIMAHNFRLRGRPFGPHPHAGFSVLSYVFEDSAASLRSRDSLGHDITMGAGGVVWTQAARGLVHHEIAADHTAHLHGLQCFVNMASKNKVAAPRVMWLEPGAVPEWHGRAGDRVRIAVGSYEGLSSPLEPIERFDFFDMYLQREVPLHLRPGWNTLIYVLEGIAIVHADGRDLQIGAEHVVAIRGEGTRAAIQSSPSAHVVIMAGAAIREPVLASGPFIMSTQAEMEDALRRYHAGDMGDLAPLPDEE